MSMFDPWVSVRDRLPEPDRLVLCAGSKGGMFLGMNPSRFGDVSTAHFNVPNARYGRYATHWTPIPAPPVKEVIK